MKVAKLSVAYVKSEEQLESAESQLAALRARCKSLGAAAHDVVRSAPDDALENPEWDRALTALVAALGGPDDAPKEPTDG